ncbi:hypothetical protein P7C70_g7741, partial [Phenoliferia sp. Uapishka_3]
MSKRSRQSLGQGHPTPTTSGPPASPSTLRRPTNTNRPRQSMGLGLGPNASFATVAGEAAAPSLVVESQRFEEWMKIATDNKRASGEKRRIARASETIDYPPSSTPR